MKPLLISLLAALLTPLLAQTPLAPGRSPDSVTPFEWFRRADDLTNIRMPGSAPFHMKVTFYAHPAVDLSLPKTAAPRADTPVPGRPFVISGDGTYEETWISSERWRREATLGTYHAVEVRADGVRKFQANSDYEPGRVLMLLDALLQPIHRFNLEPELEERPWKWDVEHLTAGSMHYVRIHHTQVMGQNEFSADLDSFEFLPAGTLVRRTVASLATTWQDDANFAGRIVPRTIQIRSMEGDLLDARVSIEPLGERPDSSQFDLPVPPAEPGMTLQNVSSRSDAGRGTERSDPPAWPPEQDAPPGAGLRVWVTVDRTGLPREMELIAATARPAADGKVPAWLQGEAAIVFRSVQHSKYPPRIVDKSPCEFFAVVDAIHGNN